MKLKAKDGENESFYTKGKHLLKYFKNRVYPLDLNLRRRSEHSIYLSLDLCGGIEEKYIQGKKII